MGGDFSGTVRRSAEGALTGDVLGCILHPPGEELTREEWLAEWLPELKRRMAGSDTGQGGIPAEQVFAELKSR